MAHYKKHPAYKNPFKPTKEEINKVYENNLKDGDYINQFKENNIININDNQIGFNPKPREQMKQLPYANIHFKCL